MKATRIGDGVYRVIHDNEVEIVYVAGSPGDRWAFCNGETYRATADAPIGPRRGPGDAVQSLSAPMPATVLKVLAVPGQDVKKGDTLIVLEAMKMELPIRAPADVTVTAVHCREGELVQANAVLADLR
jgi:biotin carboxyl carrier protein